MDYRLFQSPFSFSRLGGAVLAAVCLTALAPAVAQDGAAVQAEPAAQAVKQIRKFASDEVVRQGMSDIAAQLEAAWDAIQASQLPAADYRRLADKIEAGTVDIVKNCTLDERSDKAFHAILSDMNQALELMRREKPQIQRAGAIALRQALRNYATYFDHPDWAGPQPQ